MSANKLRLHSGDALVIVDVQNDFLPGGRLAVANGDEVVPVLNAYIDAFRRAGLPIFATRDWHPPDHFSFQTEGGIWPPHCIQHSHGAAFAQGLSLPRDAKIISKATIRQQEAYSGFERSELDTLLKKNGIKRLFIGGLATDYCVLNTVIDALKLGYRVYVLEDAIRAVDMQAGDGRHAIEVMRDLGAGFVDLSYLDQ